MDLTYTHALLVQHCAVDGRLETPVRAYAITPSKPFGPHATSVVVSFIRSGKRNGGAFRIVSDHLRYLTIEVDGQVIYDSRTEVPCNMTQWAETNARFRDNRPFQTLSGREDPRRDLDEQDTQMRPA